MNRNRILEKGYFVLAHTLGDDRWISYRCIEFFEREEELLEYLKRKYYDPTSQNGIAFTMQELLNGVFYTVEARMNGYLSEGKVRLFHGENVEELLTYLEDDFYEEYGERIYIADELREAETLTDIRRAVETFNAMQENYL